MNSVACTRGFLQGAAMFNTFNAITKYRKRSIQSQTTESLFLQRTQEQKPAISIMVSVVYSLWSTLV
jgi:hypothetical protein